MGQCRLRTMRATARSSSASMREEIDGIIITLPNFGEERAIADAIRLSGLEGSGAGAGHAGPHGNDEDFASARQLLRQDVGVQQPDAIRDSVFADGNAHGVAEFGGVQEGSGVVSSVCRVVNGLRNLRIGAIGARPAAFNTVRYSEKQLERAWHIGRNA